MSVTFSMQYVTKLAVIWLLWSSITRSRHYAQFKDRVMGSNIREPHGPHGRTVRTTFGLRLFSKKLLLFFDELLN